MSRRASTALHNASPGMPYRAVRHTGPLMALTTPMDEGEGGDADFEFALSRLAPSEQLGEFRKILRELDSLISKAIREQEFDVAARFRSEITVLRRCDPAVLSSSLRTRMQAALEVHDHEEATKYRDRLRTLKRWQPEYQLAGTWKGKFQEQGDVIIRIRYNGDVLIAEKLDGGDVGFNADVSESSVEGKTLQYFDPQLCDQLSDGVTHFKGKGRFAVRGFGKAQLYLLHDGTIAVLFLQGDAGQFVRFQRIDSYIPLDGPPSRDLTSSAAELNKLLELHSNAGV